MSYWKIRLDTTSIIIQIIEHLKNKICYVINIFYEIRIYLKKNCSYHNVICALINIK